ELQPTVSGVAVRASGVGLRVGPRTGFREKRPLPQLSIHLSDDRPRARQPEPWMTRVSRQASLPRIARTTRLRWVPQPVKATCLISPSFSHALEGRYASVWVK